MNLTGTSITEMCNVIKDYTKYTYDSCCSFLSGINITYKVARIKYKSKDVLKYNMTAADLFDKCASKYPYKAIQFSDKKLTYKNLQKQTFQIANWAIKKGIANGDVVPLFANNSPEYIAIWLGLSRFGISASLINTNLKDNSLKHCINVSFDESNSVKESDKKYVVYDKAHQEVIDNIKDSFENVEFILIEDILNECKDEKDYELNDDDTTAIFNFIAKNANSPLFYIFTSGTTGMPKAAKISHLRFIIAGFAFHTLYDLSDSDKMYISLPLYHSNGGMVGVSSAFSSGMGIVLREKFSASKYFTDCFEYDCTVGMYIGECCRYILNSKKSNYDNCHNMRLLIGNGMRPEVWKPFVDRFNVQIGEFYGSTEGNANLFNPNGNIGAIGYMPWVLRQVYPVKFVKIDKITEELIKDKKGYCIECKPGEDGEAIGLIKDDDATRKFDGYTNKEASKKKIVENVFKQGDKWFRSGDILRLEKDDYVYFVDRIGDTFRWKGENVATTEVTLNITSEPCIKGIEDVNVYGVTVPNNLDGKIGMAAIQKNNDSINFNELFERVQSLPKYAQPYFIRVLPESELTGTFKHKKVTLRKEGFNPQIVTDDLYMINYEEKTYNKLTEETYNNILTGEMRL